MLVAVDQKTNMSRLRDQRISKGQPPLVQLRDKIRDDAARHFVQRWRPGKQRSGMTVVAQPEQNQIVPKNHLTFLRG